MPHRAAISLDSTGISLRRATADDFQAIALADGRAFGFHYSEEGLADARAQFDPDRYLLACDDSPGKEEIVGVTGSYALDVTLPGGARLPAPGVTWVSVAVTHRRRGILHALLAEQHRGFIQDGLALSLLTASEGGIYGRFGYGIATEHRSVEINRRQATLRRGAPDPGGVRQVDTAEIRRIGPELHRRWAALTPGAVSRSDAWWNVHALDREEYRRSSSAMFHLAHPDGYVSFRRESDRVCRIVDMFAATPEAYAALWRTLLALDLVDTIRWRSASADEPLQHLLADPRQLRTTDIWDGMWARILDVPAALSARRYAVELEVMLDVQDAFLDRGGRFRLRGGPDGASCELVSSGGSDLVMDIATLGALLFGGARAEALARAGRLLTDDDAVLRRVDAAFLAERVPQHGTEF